MTTTTIRGAGRLRRISLVLAAVLTFSLVSPAVAGAAGESVGACIIEKVSEYNGASDDATKKKAEEAAEKCYKAPNPILPELTEIIWGTLAFLVLLGAMWKFALPGIKKGMDARADKIEGDLKAAEMARADAEGLKRDYEAKLADAKAESSRIIDDARQTGESMKAEAKTRAETEANEIKTQAANDVASQRDQALADMRGDVAELAVGAAGRVVNEKLDPSTHRRLIDEYIDGLASSNN